MGGGRTEVGQLPGGRLIILNYLHSRRGRVLNSLEYTLAGCAFPIRKTYAETSMGRLTEYIFHHHGIPHSTASKKGTDFKANEAGNGSCFKNPLVFFYSPIPWSS